MTNPFVVTINRQFGSGGREIGKRLAKTLDIAYLDKELLSLAAQKSGISEKQTTFYQTIPAISACLSMRRLRCARKGSWNCII